jgi:DtxR family Mn-dependent transcriptional regulator
VKNNDISPSLEDYLEAILNLKEANYIIRVTDLANKLQVAKASVNRAVKLLVDKDLLMHEHYGPIELTEHGRERALKIKARHQFLRNFFNEILGVELNTAERDACSIEHYISAATMEKLIAFVTSNKK